MFISQKKKTVVNKCEMYHLSASCSIFPLSYMPQGLFSSSQWEFEPNT